MQKAIQHSFWGQLSGIRFQKISLFINWLCPAVFKETWARLQVPVTTPRKFSLTLSDGSSWVQFVIAAVRSSTFGGSEGVWKLSIFSVGKQASYLDTVYDLPADALRKFWAVWRWKIVVLFNLEWHSHSKYDTIRMKMMWWSACLERAMSW